MKLPIEIYCLNINSTIKQALEVIDKNLTGAALITNDDNQIVGIITDGDIRRALLREHNIKDSIEGIYCKNFKYADCFESKKKIKEFMLNYKIRQIPVLDKEKRLVDLYFIDDMLSYDEKDNYVFIPAGGLGTRLRPLTDTIPKPMVKLQDKPILEHTIEQFREYGFRNFMISLNYRGDIIENYFGDGKRFGVNIEYVKESIKLGTAGSIALGREKLQKSFIVINGDILTGIDFDAFLNHHLKNEFDITVGVRNYEIKVPYGVMVTDDLLIKSVEEKPTYNFYINSGIYAINPEMIKYIPENEYYDMTDLINNLVERKHKSGVYQITEYWNDIGQIEDYRRANEDVKKFF